MNHLWKTQWLQIQNCQDMPRIDSWVRMTPHGSRWNLLLFVLERFRFLYITHNWKWGMQHQLLYGAVSLLAAISGVPPTVTPGTQHHDSSTLRLQGQRSAAPDYRRTCPIPELNRSVTIRCLSPKWCWELCRYTSDISPVKICHWDTYMFWRPEHFTSLTEGSWGSCLLLMG